MKLKKYNQLLKEINSLYCNNEYDDNSNKLLSKRKKYLKISKYGVYNNVNEYENIKDINIKNTIYLIRLLLKKFDIEYNIYINDLNIYINIVLKKREKIKDILILFKIIKNIKEEILSEYDSELELCENKDGRPILIFNFKYKNEFFI